MQYIQLPYYEVYTLTVDASLDDLTENCFEPSIIEGAVEGSSIVLVAADGMPDGVVVMLSTGDLGYTADEKAIVRLRLPLRKGQAISVAFNAPNCKVSSCAVVVKGLSSDFNACTPSKNVPISGTSTGVMFCDDLDLTRKVHDGEGGFMKGEIVYSDCVWCGGTKPNCEDE